MTVERTVGSDLSGKDKCNGSWQEESISLASTMPLPLLGGTRPHMKPHWATSDLLDMRITGVLRDALLSLLLAEEPGPALHSYCLTLI